MTLNQASPNNRLGVLMVVVICISLGITELAGSAEIRLLPPHRIYRDDDTLCVDVFSKNMALPPEVQDYLLYGTPVTFTYFVYFYRKAYLFDELISKVKKTRVVQYNMWLNVIL